MASEAAESSRAREEAAEREAREELARQQRPAWVALATIPLMYGADDAGAEAMAPGTGDLLLKLQDPPRASYLKLPDRLVPDAMLHRPCILGSAPGHLLLRVSHKGQGRDVVDAEYYLLDTVGGTATLLPVLPPELPVKRFVSRTIGLIADPRCPGNYMVVYLHPTPMSSSRRYSGLLYYSTATAQWAFKPLVSAPDHEPWGEHGVFAHDGLLWWVDVAYGMLVCNPFDGHPRLRFIPLPPGCKMHGLVDGPRPTSVMDHRRLVRPSQGMLRYVEIQGLSYDSAAVNAPPTVSMWTLVNPAGPHTWRFECEASFADIWAHDSYVAAGLPRGKVPKLALVDPTNHDVVYFFQDTALFALDVRARRVLACAEERLMDRNFHYSPFVDAWEWEWELPPTVSGEDPAPDGGSGTKGADTLEVVMGSPFAGQMTGFRRNIVRVNALTPFMHQHGGHNSGIPPKPKAPQKDERATVQDSIQRVSLKLREETNKRSLMKLHRERKHLGLVLSWMEATEGQQ